MERLKEVEAFIRGYWDERTNIKREFINDNFEKLKSEFSEKLVELIDDQARKKRLDDQDKIQSIYLYRLLSSAYTESYDVIIGLSGSNSYLDDNKSQLYWSPLIIYKNIYEDMEAVKMRLQKEFIRLSEYEMLWLKRTLLNDDWKFFQECFLRLVKDSMSMISESTLQLEAELQVLSGNYMDKPEILWCTKTGGAEV